MSSETERDRVFAEQKAAVADFKFGKDVATVFDDMLGRSQEDGGQLLTPALDITEDENEFRVTTELPGLTKEDVQIQLEFTNDSSNDWEARMSIEWLDGEGKPIDGYQGEEGLDSEQRHDQQTVTLSTLKYGLDRARKLKISIDTNPD